MTSISELTPADFDEFFIYLDRQLAFNGKEGSPLFMPMSRGQSVFPEDKRQSFINGLAIPVGSPHWRRAWIARDEADRICGHVDLRAHPELYATHRSLLGLGVLSSHQRQGYGATLMLHAMDWVRQSNIIEIIDLAVLSVNFPARRLYEKLGFELICEMRDKFRIDGNSESNIIMSKLL